MLGITPLVSISERRLGLITNSSTPRDSANDVLDISTSRSVRPICSRSSRNFLPAESTCIRLTTSDFRPTHSNGPYLSGPADGEEPLIFTEQTSLPVRICKCISQSAFKLPTV